MAKSKKDDNVSKPNTIEVMSLDDIKHEERLVALSKELIKMKSKQQIIEQYSRRWDCSPSTIRTLIKETIVWLSTEMRVDREDMRTLNSERLDHLFCDPNASVRDRIKIIDLLNKTNNLYDNNVKVAVEDEIVIDLGV